MDKKRRTKMKDHITIIVENPEYDKVIEIGKFDWAQITYDQL